MARTGITVDTLTRNAGTDVTASVGQGSTGSAGWAITGASRDEVVILVENTSGDTGSIEVKAPTSADDFSTASGQGDLSVMIGGDIQKAIIIDGARFRQSNGNIYLDGVGTAGAGFTGTIQAIDPTGL